MTGISADDSGEAGGPRISWQLFVASGRKPKELNDGVSRDQSGTCSKKVRSLASKLDRDGHNLGSDILQ